MMIAPEALVVDFLEWIATKPRPYREVMDAWRTSCPRLPVWEDSVDAGFVARVSTAGEGEVICVTSIGLDFLEAHGRLPFNAAARR